MGDVKKLNDYAINQTDPYDKNSKYVNKDNTLSIVANQDDLMETKNVVEIHYIVQDEVVDKIIEILKDRLKISRSGLMLFRNIYSKYTRKKHKLQEPIEIDHKVFAPDMGYNSYQSVYNSILELLDKDIIARSGNEKLYFLNPMFFTKTNNLLITEYYKKVASK